MVIVDVAHFDLDELLNHVLGLFQTLVEEILHNNKYAAMQLMESLNLLDVDEMEHLPELLMDEMRTLQRRKK